ncbi:xylosyltransferase [Tripterygium wilfordii]|uniref:Xylosyltransferase n=1 Tax=Tripterygium wilfordii TaxID=458696 RepID=A0A7J7CSW0_TRIWF|nr:beta-glucuronosyltransferase GlcAT14C-like [Tripterygium wilfordii]KAF5737161.1 xylosyltransferase [Tripterygium wilfordii]
MKRSRMDQIWLTPLIVVTILSTSLVITVTVCPGKYSLISETFQMRPKFEVPVSNRNVRGKLGLPELPRLAYLISGTRGDSSQVWRILQVVYHPNNYYLLHLDLTASDKERLELLKYVKSECVIREFRNVMVIGKSDSVTYKGPTVIASTLHAAALLLKRANDWDWFINLSASDYPLMPQDDILHIFSYLPRDLNFVEHSSRIGWKEHVRARPVIIDSGLYHSKTSSIVWAKESRVVPSSFKLFMGSEQVTLTRSFLEFCVMGWDSLPRTLLMYYTNVLSSSEAYFQTVICNHGDYQNTTVNYDLHYTPQQRNPSKQRLMKPTLEHFDDMVHSGAPFARGFSKDDPVLRKIDMELLKRQDGQFTPGAGSINAVKPTLGSERLEKLMVKLLHSETFRSKQCK